MDNIIHSRYSCRKFQNKALSKKQIETVIKAGMQAPSAKNEQPWEFIAVTEKETLRKMSKASPYAACISQAPAAVVVMADMERAGDGSWWIQDVSACIENMLLKAVDVGLGSVWLGMYPRQDRILYLKELFQLPSNFIPVAVLPLGYPLEPGAGEDRYEKERIHWEGLERRGTKA